MSDKDNEILRIGDPKSPIVITQSIFNDIRGLDIRRHYFDKKDGLTKPTSKGIWLKENEFTNIIDFLLNKKDEISNFFSSNLSEQENNVRGSHLKQFAIRRENNKKEQITVSQKNWPGNKFYDLSYQGENFFIDINSKLKIFQDLDENTLNLIGSIIYCFIKSKDLLSGSKDQATLNLLELEWGNQLNQFK